MVRPLPAGFTVAATVLGAGLEPPLGVTGRRDFRPLVDLLEQPVRAARHAPKQTVWHCSIRNDDTDRILTDEQWAHIAGEMMAGVGLAPHGDTSGVRWLRPNGHARTLTDDGGMTTPETTSATSIASGRGRDDRSTGRQG